MVPIVRWLQQCAVPADGRDRRRRRRDVASRRQALPTPTCVYLTPTPDIERHVKRFEILLYYTRHSLQNSTRSILTLLYVVPYRQI